MDYELDEMRQQMAILKDKLEKQTIVDDRVIRRAIKHGVSTINKRYLVISIIALAMIPYGYWAFVKLNGLSIPLWIASCVMMLMVVAFCFFNGRAMRDSKLTDGIGLTKAFKYIGKDVDSEPIQGKDKLWTITAAYMF